MTSTESFDGLDNVEELNAPTVSEERMDDFTIVRAPIGKRKVSNIQAAREQRERMAEINEIADAHDFGESNPEWTPEAEELREEGWVYQTVYGVRIWAHPQGGLWKSEESAVHLLRSGWEPGL